MGEMLDCVGVPEFFYSVIGKTEPAGGGCIRIYCCIERGDNLVPVLTVVMPASSLLRAAKRAEDAAIEAFNAGQITNTLGVH